MRTEARVALITGAGSGIGREVSIELVRHGWKVAGVDQQCHGLQTLETELHDRQHRFAWAVADVTDVGALTAAVQALVDQLGPIDLLIASAGIATETPALAPQAEMVAQIIRVNLIGVSNTIAAVLPAMLARRSGHVAAISSLASFRGLPSHMGYCASKAGLNALMESLRLDVKGHGIRVTTLCPGHTQTPKTSEAYKEKHLMPMARTAKEILWAIARGKRLHAFPWFLATQLRLMRLLPDKLQDWLLVRAMDAAKKSPSVLMARVKTRAGDSVAAP